MVQRKPDGSRRLQGVPLVALVGKIVIRLSKESGDHPYMCARDLRAAVDDWIEQQILYDTVMGRPTWKKLGEQLGVSAQAAHRKYRHRRLRSSS